MSPPPKVSKQDTYKLVTLVPIRTVSPILPNTTASISFTPFPPLTLLASTTRRNHVERANNPQTTLRSRTGSVAYWRRRYTRRELPCVGTRVELEDGAGRAR